MTTRCPRCGREAAEDVPSCPGCGAPLTGAAPEPERRTASAASGAGRDGAAGGLEATIPLLTAGTTMVATGAGLRGDMPGLGLAILAGGLALMLTPALRLLAPMLRGGPPVLPRRTAVAVGAALLAGVVLGAVVLGVVLPRLRGVTPVSPSLGCAGLEAIAVAEALRGSGLPVEDVRTVPVGDVGGRDPLLLLAPVSAATFRHADLAAAGPGLPRIGGAPADGGAVEVYGEPAAAAAAADRLPGAREERRLIDGPVLLRLSADVPEANVTGYESALRDAVACDGPVTG